MKGFTLHASLLDGCGWVGCKIRSTVESRYISAASAQLHVHMQVDMQVVD